MSALSMPTVSMQCDAAMAGPTLQVLPATAGCMFSFRFLIGLELAKSRPAKGRAEPTRSCLDFLASIFVSYMLQKDILSIFNRSDKKLRVCRELLRRSLGTSIA